MNSSQIRARPSPSPNRRSFSPPPSYHLPSPVPGSSSNRPRKPPPSSSRSCLRRPRSILFLLLTTIVLYILYKHYRVNDLLFLARVKLRDKSYEEGWFGGGCGMRKRPLVFVKGEYEVTVVWEMNCELPDVRVEFGRAEQKFPRLPTKAQVQAGKDSLFGSARGWSWRGLGSGKVKKWETASVEIDNNVLHDTTHTHIVYTARLLALEPGSSYTYAIYTSSKSSRPLARHTFPFLSPISSTKLSILALSDNQYNLRIFRRLLLLLPSLFKSKSQHSPNLILHAGDVVQNPHNLAQWQTDFYEPLYSAHGVGQFTPILLARGNHDWDPSGVNPNTGGHFNRTLWISHLSSPKHVKLATRRNHPGTFFSVSLHERMRVVVLDSNLKEKEDLEEQEEWLKWEVEREEWRRASLKVVVVHVPPFLEWWDREAWTEGGENQWSTFVRHRLTPIFASAGATLVISGHSHSYSRGFLPLTHSSSYTSSTSSTTVFPSPKTEHEEPGTIYTVIGGAGGTLDKDRVERWPFYESSIEQKYFVVSLEVEFGSGRGRAKGGKGGMKGRGKEGERVYRFRRRCEDESEEEVVDRLSWKAVGLDGKTLDRFEIEAEGCVEWNAM